MKQRPIIAALLLLKAIGSFAQVSLDECLSKAEERYPLIKKFDLTAQTRDLALDEINKQWLPGISVYGQGSLQNVAADFPEALTDIMSQMGHEMRGLSRLQYKAGVDVTQTVWDGGATAAQRKNVRASTHANEAALQATLYGVREKVMTLYFGALLTQEQIRQQESAIGLMMGNHEKIKAMVKAGTAMQSDADNVEAQILSASQKVAEAHGALDSYLTLLELYTGEPIRGQRLIKPRKTMPESNVSHRPELTLYDADIAKNEARREEINSMRMPKISGFVQSFYGYPGFNNFEAMMNRRLSFNILGGLRVQWTLTPFYTRKTSLKRIDIANENIMAERETFLFNTGLQSARQTTEISNMEEIISRDAEIIRLRTSVREAAEAQLANGVIDTVALLSKITDENQARLNADYHEIKLLQTIYQLKYTLNQ